jgi:hypothetical protein
MLPKQPIDQPEIDYVRAMSKNLEAQRPTLCEILARMVEEFVELRAKNAWLRTENERLEAAYDDMHDLYNPYREG